MSLSPKTATRRKMAFLVELKTDMDSLRESQSQYLLDTRRVGLKALVKGVIEIREATKKKEKYGHLLYLLAKLGLVSPPSSRNGNWRNAFDGVQATVDKQDWEIKIVYIQPTEKPDFEYIYFDEGIINLTSRCRPRRAPSAQRCPICESSGKAPVPPSSSAVNLNRWVPNFFGAWLMTLSKIDYIVGLAFRISANQPTCSDLSSFHFGLLREQAQGAVSRLNTAGDRCGQRLSDVAANSGWPPFRHNDATSTNRERLLSRLSPREDRNSNGTFAASATHGGDSTDRHQACPVYSFTEWGQLSSDRKQSHAR